MYAQSFDRSFVVAILIFLPCPAGIPEVKSFTMAGLDLIFKDAVDLAEDQEEDFRKLMFFLFLGKRNK